MRGATYMEFPAQYVNGFQSTHPVRGATTRALGVELASRISIHAPRAGCDQIIFKGMDKPAFQSTHPVRGATRAASDGGLRLRFISIHAPRAGCDFHNNDIRRILKNFNPRTPCGVRHVPGVCKGGVVLFQSTHPVRGATHPLPLLQALDAHFNPRTPCGVRRQI